MDNASTQLLASRIDEVLSDHKKRTEQLRSSTKEDRLQKLHDLKDWIKNNKGEIQKAIYADLKKAAVEVDLTDTSFVLLEINLAIKNLGKWMAPTKISTPTHMFGSTSYIHYEPRGCVLILAPWNFPFNLAVAPLVSAIAAGCTAILKPSEMAPHTSALIRRMVEEVFERNEVAVFEGGAEVAQLLLQKPFDHIFFTGSTSVGKMVMKAAAQHLAAVTLELGGKSPVIIDKGYPLKDAARKIAFGKFMNCGQTCIAPDFLLVHESQKEDFLAELKTQINNMYDPKSKGIDSNKDYGRIISEKHLKRLQHLLSDAQVKGSHIKYGGKTLEKDKYMEPTVLTEITDDMLLMQEEIFGPILPVITYHQLEEIIHLLQLKPKPLALYVFSTEKFVVNYFLKNISSGTVCVNDCCIQYMQHELPFGGVNHSGFGKTHGKAGFLAFSNEKAVLTQRVGNTLAKLFYPPYNRLGTNKITRGFMKWLSGG